MKKIRNNKIFAKVLSATLAAVISLGSAFAVMPTLHAHAADGAESQSSTGKSTVGVDMMLGLDGLRDPVKVSSSSGNSYVPSDYVYFGDNNRGTMLWRVLDADSDSLGNEGNVFIMSEYLEAASLSGKSYDESYLSYFTDAEKNALVLGGSEGGSANAFGRIWTDGAENGYLFAPSMDEINRYVADWSGAPVLRAYTDASRSTNGSWWTRSQQDGAVGYVSTAGEVYTETNTAMMTYYNRLAANLDPSNVVFSTRVDGGWRLALLDNDYVEESRFDFAAWITDFDGTVAEISYVNAKPTDTTDAEKELISVIVTDKDGKVKYYEQLGEVDVTGATETVAYMYEEGVGYKMLSPKEYYEFQGSVSFDTAGVYDNAAGDKMYVFWEKAYDSRTIDANPTLAYKTSLSSKLVEICWHEENPEVFATCWRFSECALCGTGYGDYEYTSLDAHVDGDGVSAIVWEQKLGKYIGEDGFLRDGWIHGGRCEICNLYLPIDSENVYSGYQPCFCESAEAIDCTNGAICDACGGYFVDPMMHSYDYNGICNRNTHFKEPELVDGVYQIKNIGNLLWYSQYTNGEEFIGGGADMADAILLRDLDFSELDAKKYNGKFESSNWVPICSVEHEIDSDEDGNPDDSYPTQFTAVFDGNGYEIRNLRCVSDQYKTVGFIGYVNGNMGDHPAVKNLGLVDCYFENTSAVQDANAAIVAYSDTNVTIEKCYVENTSVIGNENVGGIAGRVWGGDGIRNCYTIDLTLKENGETVKGWIVRDISNAFAPSRCFAHGEDAGLLGSAGGYISKGSYNLYASGSYYLDESGTIDSDNAKKTAEQFESGLVAYYLGSDYGQTIGLHGYPVFGGDVVYRVSVCGGEGLDKYTYSNNNEITHRASEDVVCGEELTCEVCGERFGDAVEHNYTRFDPKTGFIWADDYSTCFAQTYCLYCEEQNPTLLQATVNFDFNGGIRADYVASLYIGEKLYTSDVKWIVIMTIDEATGILPSSEKFTGEYFYAYDLVTNTKMKANEYDAYFLLDGEMVGESARDAGVYDLYIVGKGRFDHQTYTYENFFTIEKVEVEMTVSIKDKIVDETTEYEFEISFSDGCDYLNVIRVFSDQPELPSAEVGKYEITGIDFYFYHDEDASSIKITHNKSAQATILPRNYVEITNKSYKLEYQYGETVPMPRAADFEVDEGSTLSFSWFKDGVLLRSLPSNAGEYILRVSASATDEYIANYAEFYVTIAPKQLELAVDPYGECETELVDLGYDEDGDGEDDVRTVYLVEMGERVPVYVKGLPGEEGYVSINDERFESTGIEIYWRLRENGIYQPLDEGEDYEKVFPTSPITAGFRMTGTPHASNSFGVSTDVGFEEYYNIEFYFKVKSPVDEVVPIHGSSEYDGGAKEFDAVVTPSRWEIPVEDFKGESSNPKITYSTRLSLDSDIENNVLRSYSTDIQYLDKVNPVQIIQLSESGEMYVSVVASYIIYSWNGNVEGSREVMRAKITVEIYDQFGDMVDEICDSGEYTVKIKTEPVDESGNVIGEAKTNTATHKVRAPQREVYLIVKETEINLDGEVPKYDEKDVVFLPGYTLAPGHRIVDLAYDIELGGYVGAFNMGNITVDDWVIVDESGRDVSDEYVIYSELYQWSDKYEEVYGEKFENVKNHGKVHAYSNACDTTCNIDGCKTMRRAEPHTGGRATCTTQAICEVCGSEYGGYDGTNHSGADTVYVQNTSNFNYHDLVLSCCGEVKSSEKHTVTKNATCHSLAECKLCGVVEGSYDYTKHTSDEMYYITSPSDPSKHEYRHKCCDLVESTGTHAGGRATCTDLAVCDTCELGYGELDADSHSSDKFKHTATEKSALTHEVSHACCGAYVKTEQHSGGEATCTGKARCQGCGAEYGDMNASNHASGEYTYSAATVGDVHYVYYACCGVVAGADEHSGGGANCTSGAVCQYCSIEYGKKDPATHASAEFEYKCNSSDPEKHDKTAKCCGALIATEDHTGGSATCMDKATCESCKAQYGEMAAHVYDSVCDSDCNVCGAERLSGHTDSNKDKICDGCGAELSKGNDGQGGDGAGNDTENGTESEIESDLEAESESETASGQSGGCKSTVGAGAVTVIISLVFVGVAMIKRKKD